MEDLDKEMVELKIVIEGGKHSEDETDNWIDHICVEMPTYPDLVKMYGAGSPNELRMLYLMNQQNFEIFSAYGDETPDEQKQQRRLINAFKEVVEETNGEVLKNMVPYFSGIKENGAELSGNTMIGNNSNISNGSKILGPCIIGENCMIGENCTIGPNVSIGNNSKLKNCNIQNSIVMENCVIDSDMKIRNSILASNSSITINTDDEKVLLLGEGTKISL